MKIISYCLYGSNPRYLVGMQKNAEIVKNILPDWLCYVYYDFLPKDMIDKLLNFENVKLFKIENMIGHGAFWRFLPFFENENNICISRDTDSRITDREVICINEWLKSNKKFHIIKDHNQHYNVPIMAGMWGMKGKLDKTLFDNMISFINSGYSYYGKDQNWLSYLWQYAQKDCLIHGFKETSWLNETRKQMENPYNFIGNGWTENEQPIYHYEDHGRCII